MNITKAIQLLQQDLNDPGSVAIENLNQAEELGINALKFYKREKAANVSGIWTLLPGETDG